MTESPRTEIENTVNELIEDVGSWPGVAVGEHRFGGTEWRVGPREIGHIHAWGMLDIAYLRALRDVLIEEGKTGVHHLLDQSGWTTYYIDSSADYDHAVGSSGCPICTTSMSSKRPPQAPRNTTP